MWFVLLLRRLIVDTWWLSKELNMKLETQFITFVRKPSCWMDQIKWLVYLMGHGVQSLLAGVREAGNNKKFSQSWLCWSFELKIFIFLDVMLGMFLFPAVNHKPPFLFVMTNTSHYSLPLSFWSARCPVPSQRSRVIVGGLKRWPYDLTDGVVAHGENVTFFCKHPEKLCSFTATEVCVDGHLKAPSCFLGTQLPPHLYT